MSAEPRAGAPPDGLGGAAAARQRFGASPVHALLLFSGFAGLGYQVVWTRMLSTGLGHEIFAILAVVAAFFAGLALGAALLDRRIALSRRPGLWYALLEALIGVWTLGLIWMIPVANGFFADLIGPNPSESRRWAVAFLGPMLLLLPATAAMGATLPAAERLYARRAVDGRGVGGLYAANTAGAMAGALLTAVWLAPTLGYSATLVVFAVINFGCAVAMALGPARGEAARPALGARLAGTGPTPGLLGALFVTGLLGVGYEVAVVRALSQLLQNTVYSFAAILAVYLLGAAIGAAAYQRRYAHRRGEGWDAAVLGPLSAAAGAAGALGALAVFAVEPTYDAARALLGGGVAGSIAAELICAALTFGPASVAMGALFAHLAQGARGREGGLGAAFAANTLGAALAPLLVGVVAVPALGAVGAMVALSLAYLGFLALAWPAGARQWAPFAAALLLTAVVLAGPFDRRLVAPPPGGAIHTHVEGVAGAATVTVDQAGNRHLIVNGGFVMGGTASYALDRIQGHAVLMRHPRPERALFLGVGTGATLAAAAAYPALRTEGVELLDEVLATVPAFEAAHADLDGAAARVSLHVGDARRYVRSAQTPYDVILADNFHPAKDGAGLLYTVEHFEAIRAQLAADGVFAQWLPLHQLDMPTLRLIARSFLHVFPDAQLALGNNNLATPILALYGSATGRPPALAALAARTPPPRLSRELSAVGLGSPYALFGGFLAGPHALRRFVGEGPLNTDDHPRVVFEAPRTVYAPLAPASERLLTLIDAFEPRAADALEIPATPAGAAFGARLEAYWRARDAFIGLGVRQQSGGPASLGALAFALADIVAVSADFDPAYLPALQMARSLARTDRAAALAVLDALAAAAPSRPEARALRAQLTGR